MAELLDEPATYSIAEAAERLGLTADTLRYYERDGLLVETPGRAPSGHRRYTENDLGWILLITRLRATGMPIRRVRAYAELCRQGEGNELARLELLYQHRDQVLAQAGRGHRPSRGDQPQDRRVRGVGEHRPAEHRPTGVACSWW